MAVTPGAVTHVLDFAVARLARQSAGTLASGQVLPRTILGDVAGPGGLQPGEHGQTMRDVLLVSHKHSLHQEFGFAEPISQCAARILSRGGWCCQGAELRPTGEVEKERERERERAAEERDEREAPWHSHAEDTRARFSKDGRDRGGGGRDLGDSGRDILQARDRDPGHSGRDILRARDRDQGESRRDILRQGVDSGRDLWDSGRDIRNSRDNLGPYGGLMEDWGSNGSGGDEDSDRSLSEGRRQEGGLDDLVPKREAHGLVDLMPKREGHGVKQGERERAKEEHEEEEGSWYSDGGSEAGAKEWSAPLCTSPRLERY